MYNDLTRDVVKVCKALNKYSVEYLIVGGTAVAIYGFYRISISRSGLPVDKHDLDFWYNPTYNNYFNLLKALEELGEDISEFMEEKTPNPKKSFFQLEREAFTLDFLPEIKGLTSFRKTFAEKEVSKVDDTEIFLISREDLIINKKATGRPKDITDIDYLESGGSEI